jgi:pimeloyl-ACP methyl ester carboxylesterase
VVALQARKHLVVVLPGIGGSVLAAAGKGDCVWDAGFRDVAGLVVRPGLLSLAEAPDLRPAGLIRSRRLVPGWTVISGYDGLLRQLGTLPGAVVDDGHPDRRRPDANIVAVPYDFRRSIVDAAEHLAAEVKIRLSGLDDAAKSGRVVVVAHSMGGLVARYWLGPLGGWPVCRALITLGTPHRGAPKALDTLVNGVRGGGLRLGGATDLLREWPSVAELLPRYRAVWDETTAQARYPHELGHPRLGKAVAAFAVHEEIEKAWQDLPRGGPEMVPQARLESRDARCRELERGHAARVTKDLPGWLDVPGWEDDHGDGTVPAISAVPIEADQQATDGWRVRDRHGPLASSRLVATLVEQYEGRAPLTPVRGGRLRPVAIGMTLEEMYPASTPIPLEVVLRGVQGGGVEHPVWATVRRAEDRARVAEVRLDWDAARQRYIADLPGQPPDVYDVEITARSMPGAGDLSAADSVAVVEP